MCVPITNSAKLDSLLQAAVYTVRATENLKSFGMHGIRHLIGFRTQVHCAHFADARQLLQLDLASGLRENRLYALLQVNRAKEVV
jgi:hypothetical protein